ncbi:MAG: DUF5655 domain-containing protein [Aristaeellaceae bacterium]
MTGDTALFFDRAPELLPLYAALEEAVLSICPDTRVLVMKSQIAFTVARRFAFASLRGRRLIVTFGLPYRVESPRIRQAVEPYPNRWTHHVILRSRSEIDDTLLGWIEEAWRFASRK